MKIGFIGVGKLGLPVSLMYAVKGHHLYCYDINQKLYAPNNYLDCLYEEELSPDKKTTLKEYLRDKTIDINFSTLENVCINSDIIFVAVQTPHSSEYEGISRLPDTRKDFNYEYLIESIKNISYTLDNLNIIRPIVIISTVLPGTIRQYIYPILSKNVKLCYNPYFIAMGTVASDCLFPEFILLGN